MGLFYAFQGKNEVDIKNNFLMIKKLVSLLIYLDFVIIDKQKLEGVF
jgi:hypothetical protein